MDIRWDRAKDDWLKRVRGVGFKEIMRARFIAREAHPRKPHQKLMFFEMNGYIWVVPYVRDENGIFLKTLFPSRVYTRKWMEGRLNEEKNSFD